MLFFFAFADSERTAIVGASGQAAVFPDFGGIEAIAGFGADRSVAHFAGIEFLIAAHPGAVVLLGLACSDEKRHAIGGASGAAAGTPNLGIVVLRAFEDCRAGNVANFVARNGSVAANGGRRQILRCAAAASERRKRQYPNNTIDAANHAIIPFSKQFWRRFGAHPIGQRHAMGAKKRPNTKH